MNEPTKYALDCVLCVCLANCICKVAKTEAYMEAHRATKRTNERAGMCSPHQCINVCVCVLLRIFMSLPAVWIPCATQYMRYIEAHRGAPTMYPYTQRQRQRQRQLRRRNYHPCYILMQWKIVSIFPPFLLAKWHIMCILHAFIAYHGQNITFDGGIQSTLTLGRLVARFVGCRSVGWTRDREKELQTNRYTYV